MRYASLTALALALILSTSVGYAQDNAACPPAAPPPEPPVEGTSRFITTVQPEIYATDEWGNQAWVREYDADYNNIDLGVAQSVGYDGPTQYQFLGRELMTGDYLANLDAAYGYDVSVKFGMSKLIHRLDWIQSPEPGIQPPSSQTTFVSVVDRAESLIDRKVAGAELRWHIPGLRDTSLVTAWWGQNKSGSRQMLWFGRTGFVAFQRASTEIPVDNNTSEPAVGFDTRIGDRTALSYRFAYTDFDGTKDPPLLPGLPNEPIRIKQEFDTNTHTNDVRLRTDLTENLNLTGFYTIKNRKHLVAGSQPVSFEGPPLAPITSDVTADISTGSFALNYYPGGHWYLSAKQYRNDYSVNEPAVLEPAEEPGEFDRLNQQKSWRDIRTSLDAEFTGIPRWQFGLGYERRNMDSYRLESAVPIFDSSDHNVYSFSVTGRPTDELSMSLYNSYDSVDVPEYRGKLDAIWNLGLTSVYTPKTDLLFNLSFWHNHGKNGVLTVAGLPPLLPPTDPGFTEQRDFIAGAGFENETNTLQFGIWKGLTDKLAVDLGYGRDWLDASTLWVLGTDPAFLPVLPPFVTPMDATSNLYNVGLTYNVTPKWRFRGNWTYVNAFGNQYPDIFQLTRPGDGVVDWNPVSNRNIRYSLSAGYNFNASTQIDLEYSAFQWRDRIDPRNDGNFHVFTIAGVKRF